VRTFRRIIQTLTLAAVVTTAAVVGAWTVSAATVTSANDYPSTLQTSQAANHRVLFTTPTGVSEGSTIVLTFATSFDTSTITEDDVDIGDDGTDLTTAATCAGSEQASVAMASDVLTITICAGDGGAIAATSSITVEIGTNATSSGTGSNRITNPSSTGNYYVAISGTFGDSGSIVLPIGGDDSLSVTATVPSSGGGSGGGSGGSESEATPDTTVPTISSILVSSVTTSSATISWSTSEAAQSRVTYWVTGSTSTTTASTSGFFTTHSFALSGLSEGSSYSFYVTSTDSSGNAATSSTQTFTTLDETDPVISDIEVVDVTTTTARVTWTTNESANSAVAYGTTTAYGLSATDSSLVTSHTVLLTDLSAGTVYQFQVLSTDASSNQAFSSNQTFTTDEDTAPGNVSSLSIVVGNGQLSLSWSNPADDDLAGIRVLRCVSGYPRSSTDSACTVVSTRLTTSLSQTGLTNGTTYYFGVFAYDEAGQFASGALGMGTPQAPEEEVPSQEETAEEESSDEEPGGEELPDTGEEPGQEESSSEETTSSDSAVSCGDSVCSATESSLVCPADCGEPEEPTSLGAEDGGLDSADVQFMVAETVLTLTTTSSGVVEVTPTSDVRVAIPADTVSDDVETIVLTVADDTYLMRLDDATGLYLADITIPDVLTILDVYVLVTYIDGSTESVSSYLRVVAPGRVYQVVDGEEAAVTSAVVTLFEQVDGEWIVWDGSPYGQFNPTRVSVLGEFSWYVPNGTYRVSVSADGFEPALSRTLTVSNAIVNPQIRLTAREEEEEIVSPTPSSEEKTDEGKRAPTTLAESFLAALPIEAVQQTMETIRELPGVEEAAEFSTPALAITAGASVVVLSVAFDFLPFLQYFFTAPVLFFWRRRRKGYGVVYNAIAKTPIDLAVVRLFQVTDEVAAPRGRLVKSRVTDKGGRYFFLVHPGKYRIEVRKPGFDHPSDYLKAEQTDGQYLDLYHSEIIEVTADNALITANIPMDPSQAAAYHEPASVRRRKILRALQHTVAIVGVVTAIVFAIIRPTIFSIGMIVVQVGVYLLARRLARPQKPISWGIVYDKQTGRPLSRVVARIFEPKYNKLLETQVTDSKGRYAFILGPNQYFATFQKKGFKEKDIDPIDYSATQEPKGFSEAVALEPDDS
jgi:hypothetical protein